MERLPSVLLLPLLGGLFVLAVGGILGTVFSVVGSAGTIAIGMAIVVLAPVVGGVLTRR